MPHKTTLRPTCKYHQIQFHRQRNRLTNQIQNTRRRRLWRRVYWLSLDLKPKSTLLQSASTGDALRRSNLLQGAVPSPQDSDKQLRGQHQPQPGLTLDLPVSQEGRVEDEDARALQPDLHGGNNRPWLCSNQEPDAWLRTSLQPVFSKWLPPKRHREEP